MAATAKAYCKHCEQSYLTSNFDREMYALRQERWRSPADREPSPVRHAAARAKVARIRGIFGVGMRLIRRWLGEDVADGYFKPWQQSGRGILAWPEDAVDRVLSFP